MLVECLKKFDVVMLHAFEAFREDNDELPPFMDVINAEKARLYTMSVFREGHLNEMYERITKGLV